MWMRQFVLNHPSYSHDSLVTDEIQYDLIWLIRQMANNEQSVPLLTPSYIKSQT
jgi:glutamate--cysteine ligase catalytic subunit